MRRSLLSRLRNRSFGFVPIASAIIVAIWSYHVSSPPTSMAMALSLGLMAFCVCNLLISTTQENEPKLSAGSPTKFQALDLGILILYALIIPILLLSPRGPMSLQANWSTIPPIELMRLTFSILLTMFLPGYAILRFLDNKRRISEMMLVPVSYVLALGFTVVTALLLGGSGVSTPSLIVLNLIPILLLGFRAARTERSHNSFTKEDDPGMIRHHRFTQQKLLLTSVFMFVLVAIFTVYFVNPWLRGDLWRHFADATFVMKYGLANRGYYYPWFNALLWAQMFTVSGFPAVNAVLICVSLLFPISIFAFFGAVRSLTQNSVLAGLSTAFWSTFAGFDWIGTINFQDYGSLKAAALTYESGIFNPPGFFGFDHPTFLVGVICMLILVTLFTDASISSTTRIPLVSLVFYVGYMIDVEVMVIFLIGFLPFIALIRRTNRYVVTPQSIVALLAGLALVATTDWITPSQVKFYLNDTYLIVWIIGVSALGVLLAARLRIRAVLSRLRLIEVHPPDWIFKLGATYAYALSFIILFYSIPYLPWRPFFNNVPAYQYSFRLGTVGILALILLLIPAMIRPYSMRGSNLRLTGFITLGLLVEAEISGWLGLFDQTRFFYPAFLLICVLAAAGLASLSAYIVRIPRVRVFTPRGLAVVALVSLVMISGVSSTLLSVNLWTKAAGPWIEPISPTAEERSATDLLRNLNPSTPFTVATPTLHWSSYDNQLVSLSGARILYDNQLSLLFGTRDPTTALTVLETQGVKYIWVSQSRLEPLFNSSYVMSHLIQNLRPIFKGSDIRIYEVPSFHFTAGTDVSASIEGGYISPQEYYAPEMLALSGMSYDSFASNDNSRLNAQTILLTSDSSYAGWLDYNFSNWAAGSGSVVQSKDAVTYSTSNYTNPYYDFTSPTLRINATQQPYLLLNWRMPITAQTHAGLSLFIHGSLTGFHYVDLGYSNTWTLSRFNLRDFMSFGTSALGRVPNTHDMIRPDETVDGIILRTGDQNSYYQLKSIAIVDNPSTPSLSATELAAAGKSVVVVNTYGYGSIAHLLGFQFNKRMISIDGFGTADATISVPESELTFSGQATNATVLSSYSFMGRTVAPLAYEIPWGKGKIVYLDLKPYLDVLSRLPESQNRYDLFTALKNIPSLIGLRQSSVDPYFSPRTPPIGFVEALGRIAFSQAEFIGNIAINSSFLEGISESKLSALNLDSVPLDVPASGLFLRNLASNGTMEILITSNMALLQSDANYAGYSIITTATGTNITILAQSSVALELGPSDPGQQNIIVHGEVASITYSEPVTFSVRNPSITNSAESRFFNAWCDELGGKPFLSRGGTVTITGNMRLAIESTSPNMQDGSVQPEDLARPNEQSTTSLYFAFYLYNEIPWVSIATSRWNLALLGAVGVVSAGLSNLLRRLNRRTRR